MTFRNALLAVLVVAAAAACGRGPTEAPLRVDSAPASHDDTPPDSATVQGDTTRRGGGGTIGSGT